MSGTSYEIELAEALSYAKTIAVDVEHTDPLFYVQSFTIAANGAPIVRARWAGEHGEYHFERLSADQNDNEPPRCAEHGNLNCPECWW